MQQIRPRPKSIEQLRQDLFELSKPFVRAKCDILARSLPSMIRYPDGRLEVIYRAEARAEIAEYDRLWLEARNHFCTENGLETR